MRQPEPGSGRYLQSCNRRSKEEAFATAKKACLNMIAAQKNLAGDTDVHNKLNEMEEKLAKKTYDFNSYTKDMLYMTELQEVLK